MNVHYSDYLQLDKILNAQEMECEKHGVNAHDEMLFIIIHQAYELWFKQILFEIDSIIEIMNKPEINDNGPDLQMAVHRLGRIGTILKVLVHQIDILETMTPMDFLDFRDYLRPASGFQSWQFKITEAKLGLKFEGRHGQEYYTSQLRPEQVAIIKEVESSPSVIELLNTWLERMPFFSDELLWNNYTKLSHSSNEIHPFWNDYRHVYQNSLTEGEKHNLKGFDDIFINGGVEGFRFSSSAARSAMFIILYRDYPLLNLPFQFLNNLLEIDEQLSTWRFRHVNMVHRMIGSRVGTGGSTGKDYLMGALMKHYIFKDISTLTSFLVERRKLPKLSKELETVLGFKNS
jgi:tryptophan 2,3-dioxygenase